MAMRTQEPQPELTTTGTGGRSARLIALGVVVVLGAVVYVGISQRQPQTTAPSHPPAAAVASATTAASPLATTQLAPSAPGVASPSAGAPMLEILDQGRGPVGPHGDLGVYLTVNGETLLARLADVDSLRLHAAYRVALPAASGFGTLQLVDGGLDTATQYGSWAVPLSLAPTTQNLDIDISADAPTVLFEQEQPPDPSADESATPLVRDGYRIRVSGSVTGTSATINVDLQLARERTFPTEGYNVVATVGRRTFRTNQSTLTISPGYMRGEIFMPLDLNANTVSVSLTAVPADGGDPVVVTSQTFRVPTSGDHEVSESSISSRGQPDPALPQILVNGYAFQLVLNFQGDVRALSWKLNINPTFNLDP